MEENEWIKPGEHVYIYSHGSEKHARKHVIERVTKTQFALSNGMKYRIRDLRRVGDDDRWWRTTVVWAKSEKGQELARIRALHLKMIKVEALFEVFQRNPTDLNRQKLIDYLTEGFK